MTNATNRTVNAGSMLAKRRDDLEKGRDAARIIIGARAAGDRVVVRADQKDFTVTRAAAARDFEVQATNSRNVVGEPLDGIALTAPIRARRMTQPPAAT